MLRFFHRQGYALKVLQPWPDRQDEAERERFRQKLKELCAQPEVDIWFADESGFDGDPRPRRRWDLKGRKTRATNNRGPLRINVIGMVCPRTGQFFAIQSSHSDAETFQAFLYEAIKHVSLTQVVKVLVLDNASLHHKKSLNWQGWQPLNLPAYSPDFNPIERLWLVMKARWLNNYVCRLLDQLLQRLDQAILDVIHQPELTQKTAAIGMLF